jgi:hypothetical protein
MGIATKPMYLGAVAAAGFVCDGIAKLSNGTLVFAAMPPKAAPKARSPAAAGPTPEPTAASSPRKAKTAPPRR